GSSRLSWLTYYPIERWLSRLTDKLITITHEDYELASKKFHCQVVHTHGVGVDESRYTAVPVQLKQELRLKMGYDARQKIILCIGELNANKSQSMAIRMMRRIVEAYPNALLLLAGNGPLQAQLDQLIASEGLSNNVRMLGYVTNLQDYQHIVDVQVCCSKREGLPLNVVESMLSGNPVVATVNRGHRELISDGQTGFLVPIDDSNAMADRVLSLLRDNEMRSKIVAQASAFAAQYTFTNVKKELQSIYNLNL
ncbi:MAG: glycosyltransferase, partial [Muribaculaceae bacterium]